MDVYEALYTTRAMRRVRTDPVPERVQARILDAAIRAPSGGNSQNWRFILGRREAPQLGLPYRDCMARCDDGYRDGEGQAKQSDDP